MQLLYNIDPRDPLEKANRDQMYQYAERHKIKEIEWWMAGNQMRSILRKNGIKDLGLPEHQLGMPYGTAKQSSVPVQTNSVDQLEQSQWEAQARDVQSRLSPEQVKIAEQHFGIKEHFRAVDPQEWVVIPGMTRAQLAKACKQRGIKMARTDSKEKLVERLSGKQNAA